ncbi:MAG: DUF2079 domain-containing protein [Caldilineaceae bacterium]|nr:DUF2079 domain-containing protein [Caldilineaceae bacterium]
MAIIAYAATFSLITLERYAAFEARALDMGNLNQAIWNTAHGNWFHLTNQPGTVNRLSLHVEPILLPIAALYRLYPQPPLLLVLQAMVVALGALPLFALARRQLHGDWAALAFALVYLLHPTIQAANWLEFHPVTLAPTFLLAAFYFLVAGRAGWFALFAVLAASCKEEMALLVFMLGLYALVIQRRARWGLITMALALVWAWLAVFVIQTRFAAGNIHWGRYGYLGETPGAMVASLLTRPGLVWAQLAAAQAGDYLWKLLWPTGFLALLAPEALLLALPSLAINLLADFPPMHQVHTLIYAAPIVPFVLAAAVMGLARLRDWLGQRAAWGRWVVPGMAGLVLLLGLVDQRLHGYLPGSGNALALTVTEHHRRAAPLIAQITPDAKVSAQDRLNPHVSGRETVYIFPRIEDAGTVLVDVTGPAWPQHPNDVRATVDGLLADGFGVAAAEDGYLLLRRGVRAGPLPAAFYTVWQRPDARPSNTQPAIFGDELRLLGHEVTADRYGELVVNLLWETPVPLGRDLRFYVAYLAPDGTLLHDSEFYPPVVVLWYPTSTWTPGMPVQLSTLPWTLEADRFTLALGVYAGENWAEGDRLAVDAADSGLPALENGTLLRLGGYQRSPSGGWTPIPFDTGAPAVPLDVRFGPSLALEGVTLPATAQAGALLPFTVFWRTDAPVEQDYTAFVHLLDAAGSTAAQIDWQPRDALGPLPTSAWLPGHRVVDVQTLRLPDELAPGVYRLIAGLYDWRDGARLPAQGAQALPGDVADLGTVEIE